MTTSLTPPAGPSAPPDGARAGGGAAMVAGVTLVALCALAQIAYGVAAIGGMNTLEERVRQIESTQHIGHLFLSLGGWGVILVLVGTAQLGAARSLARRRPHGRLLAASGTLFGLGASCFTLPLFRVAAVATAVVQIATLYILSYRVQDPAP